MEKPSAFEFINIHGAPKESKEVRSLARAHVMKEYRRSKKESALVRNSSPESNDSNDSAESPSPSLPPNLPGSLDLFAEFPVKMGPRMYMLVQHYITVLAPRCSPSEVGWEAWFKISMGDPALFHIVLVSAAAHYNSLLGFLKSPEVLFHKGKAIQLVNERLSRPKRIPSDLTIRVVLHLAMIESVSGNHDTWNLHMNGLREMVKLRGGLASLPRPIQQKICMAECYGCVEQDTPPRLVFLVESHRSQPKALCIPPGFENLPAPFILDPDIVATLRNLTTFTASISEDRTQAPAQGEEADYVITSLRCRLLSALPSDAINDVCRLGLLISLQTIVYQFPVPGQPYAIILDKLRRHLETMERDSYPELMMWLAFQGGMISKEGPRRSWFVSYIWNIAGLELRLQSGKDVSAVLMKFIWVESRYNEPCSNLWREAWMAGTRSARSETGSVGNNILEDM